MSNSECAPKRAPADHSEFRAVLTARPLRAASISIRAELLPFRGFVSALEAESTWRDLLPGALRSRMTAAAKAGRLIDP